VFRRAIAFASIPKACDPSTSLRTGFEAATRFSSILSSGSLIQIAVCGEAILALFSIRGRDALATWRWLFLGQTHVLRKQGTGAKKLDSCFHRNDKTISRSLIIGFDWLCFLRLRQTVYCHNFLSYKTLRQIAHFKIGFVFSNRTLSFHSHSSYLGFRA